LGGSLPFFAGCVPTGAEGGVDGIAWADWQDEGGLSHQNGIHSLGFLFVRDSCILVPVPQTLGNLIASALVLLIL
jgi:hypothetical protein